MEFDPRNHVIRLCIQAMEAEAANRPDEAIRLYMQAWDEGTSDFEKFTSAYFVARHQEAVSDKLLWLKTALEFASRIDDVSVRAAFPALYTSIARCYDELHDADNAAANRELAASFTKDPADNGPFYHGTRADLQVGDLLKPGGSSNYKDQLVMNHIYFTALVNGAGLAAALARGDGPERVYIVEPTGPFEHDPNVTDQKFPGNPTRSYRSRSPLRVVGEVAEWARQTPEELQRWREKLAVNKGEIIN
jgi:hypothetical protein